MLLGNILAGTLLTLVVTAQTEPTLASGASPVPPYPEMLLQQVPRLDKDVEERLTLAQTRMVELKQLLAAPPPEATDEVATAIRSLQQSAYRACGRLSEALRTPTAGDSPGSNADAWCCRRHQ